MLSSIFSPIPTQDQFKVRSNYNAGRITALVLIFLTIAMMILGTTFLQMARTPSAIHSGYQSILFHFGGLYLLIWGGMVGTSGILVSFYSMIQKCRLNVPQTVLQDASEETLDHLS